MNSYDYAILLKSESKQRPTLALMQWFLKICKYKFSRLITLVQEKGSPPLNKSAPDLWFRNNVCGIVTMNFSELVQAYFINEDIMCIGTSYSQSVFDRFIYTELTADYISVESPVFQPRRPDIEM